MPRLNRPKSETNEVTTIWTLLALASRPELQEMSAPSRERALAWLREHDAKPGRSNESLLLHMLLRQSLGDSAQTDARLKELLAEQNADGGRSWVRGRTESDAFATGQTLYALRIVGVAASDPVVELARELLAQDAATGWVLDREQRRLQRRPKSRPPGPHSRDLELLGHDVGNDRAGAGPAIAIPHWAKS